MAIPPCPTISAYKRRASARTDIRGVMVILIELLSVGEM
jgi:hypothetical protein